ncbi:hypothetical protein EOW77_0005050 [Bradyrhizobium yuanmingense]|uniref:LOG family protein n=1 Tax=Bradyrhizobium yuanmingense TaxID=108015 RepID=UPI000FE30D16|nr:hypothetical protein [Bradyrhizobium yuanmingense]TGN89679.1 hypothetical protein EOW77_0005050 [Bradyrhizobium yuanmingense]
MSTSEDLPFQPIRSSLYESAELMRGFDVGDATSHGRIPDFLTYIYFVVNGRATPSSRDAGMMEALHDNSILRAMWRFVAERKQPTAAIMGGHKEPRGSKAYVAVAEIARRLTKGGYLMASGGGPGAMEATHLGALLAHEDDKDALQKAIVDLEKCRTLPASMNIVAPDGKVDDAIVKQVHEWAVPAVQLLGKIEKPGVSLAVPTWHYGHEPLTPLATHVAKYFLNSIREDVLLALAVNGIIFAPGRAGTLQEVFQDAAQNYYRGDGPFSPMIFFDRTFWRETLPVENLLEALFVKNGHGDEYKEKVRFTDDVDEVVGLLLAQKAGSEERLMSRMETMGMADMLV